MLKYYLHDLQFQTVKEMLPVHETHKYKMKSSSLLTQVVGCK